MKEFLAINERVETLLMGYKGFRDTAYGDRAALFEELADKGQSPHTLVISCCDSRVDPELIFDAEPGEIFVSRNIANLVPPFERASDYHSISAVIEFAVTGLKVENILVMGHARCGGVAKALENARAGVHRSSDDLGFIDKWVTLLADAADAVIAANPDANDAELRPKLERAAVRASVENLRSFPFVLERLDAGTLGIYGGYFDLKEGTLHMLQADSTFRELRTDD